LHKVKPPLFQTLGALSLVAAMVAPSLLLRVAVLAASASAAASAAASLAPEGVCRGGSTCMSGQSAVQQEQALLQLNADRSFSQLADAGSQNSSAGSELTLSTFFWNVHWECSNAARGASTNCKTQVALRFAKLARDFGAEIVASVELSDGMSQPVKLPSYGLSGWTQVDGPCQKGSGGDSSALAFAPGWNVLSSGGGCLRHDSDTRAFAVAKVTPPVPIQGCSSLCVVAIHAPHGTITKGHEEVSRVCGEAKRTCTLAMGDWNVPVGDGLNSRWSELISGQAPPLLAEPNERTCCFPDSDHYGVFDHLASNIAGARSAGHEVLPYQILEENPVKQHRPVVARISLPTDGSTPIS